MMDLVIIWSFVIPIHTYLIVSHIYLSPLDF